MEYIIQHKHGLIKKEVFTYKLPLHQPKVWAYLAGLFDSSGGVLIKRNPVRICIQISHLDSGLMYEVKELVKSAVISTMVLANKKTYYIATVDNLAAVYAVSNELVPYTRHKNKHKRLISLINFIETDYFIDILNMEDNQPKK